MKNKNVVIALVVSLAVGVTTLLVVSPAKVGNNEVSEIPVVTADVPVTTELPSFKYSLKPMTFNVQKEAEATKKGFTLVPEPKTDKENEVKIASVDDQKEEDQTRYYKVPLSNPMQKYTFDVAQQEGISYELVLAIMAVESDYDFSAISYDNSSKGLMQVNVRTTFYPMAKELGISNPDVFNPAHNMRVGVHYIKTLVDAWKNNSPEQDLMSHVILSYRFGVSGSKRHSLNHPYVQKVKSIKYALEKGEYVHE